MTSASHGPMTIAIDATCALPPGRRGGQRLRIRDQPGRYLCSRGTRGGKDHAVRCEFWRRDTKSLPIRSGYRPSEAADAAVIPYSGGFCGLLPSVIPIAGGITPCRRAPRSVRWGGRERHVVYGWKATPWVTTARNLRFLPVPANDAAARPYSTAKENDSGHTAGADGRTYGRHRSRARVFIRSFFFFDSFETNYVAADAVQVQCRRSLSSVHVEWELSEWELSRSDRQPARAGEDIMSCLWQKDNAGFG